METNDSSRRGRAAALKGGGFLYPPFLRRAVSLAAALALGVGFARPALAASGNCELQVHTHTGQCYLERPGGQTFLICPLPVHIHRSECFPQPPETETTLPETETNAPETETAPPATETQATVPEEIFLFEDLIQEIQAAAPHTADPMDGDLPTVSGDGIRFRLFNYSLDINKAPGNAAWRPISNYFTFRNSSLPSGETPSADIHIPSPNCNPGYDADGFTANHATVEQKLSNGLPVLSLTRNPDPEGSDRTDPGLSADARSLAYLFSGGDHAVTAYSPGNTILQKSGNRYFYNSRDHAVDYDTAANVFRLRSYAERNSTTADSGSGYGDFLPFTYTGGEILGAVEGTDYHIASADVDYWFGMTMDLRFFQSRDGRTEGEDMIFRFSGDDDVWVFVDDVLVLDLGGTHGTATGSINFATGEVIQYLSWNGGTAESETTSFPTTIRACFDAAGASPAGGWNETGTTFANYSEHTLKFFYLERGAAVANCLLDFRLPILPDNSLTVTKEVTGIPWDGSFPFTAEVTLDGSPAVLPQPAAGAAYRVNGNTISFSLSHGQSITIPGIPYKACVTVTETGFAGFSPWVQVEGLDEAPIPGNAVTVSFTDQPEILHFINNGGYQLPATGGPGTLPGYFAGAAMLLASAAQIIRYRRRKEDSG